MKESRINSIYNDYNKALKRLEEALAEDIKKSSVIIDGVIQRFEFTFELSWKMIKIFLEFEGIICSSPRACIKQAYRFGLIKDEKGWLSLMEDRNLASHIYNENTAIEIFERIKSNHVELFKKLKDGIKEQF